MVLVGRSAEKTAAVAAELDGALALTADFARLDDVRRLAAQLLRPVRPDRRAGRQRRGLVRPAGGDRRRARADPAGRPPGPLPADPAARGAAAGRPRPGGGHLVVRALGRRGAARDTCSTVRRPLRRHPGLCPGQVVQRAVRPRAGPALGAEVTAVSFDPGAVATGFGRAAGGATGLAFRSPLDRVHAHAGAGRGHAGVAGHRGRRGGATAAHHADRSRALTLPSARDDVRARELWELSAERVGLPAADRSARRPRLAGHRPGCTVTEPGSAREVGGDGWAADPGAQRVLLTGPRAEQGPAQVGDLPGPVQPRVGPRCGEQLRAGRRCATSCWATRASRNAAVGRPARWCGGGGQGPLRPWCRWPRAAGGCRCGGTAAARPTSPTAMPTTVSPSRIVIRSAPDGLPAPRCTRDSETGVISETASTYWLATSSSTPTSITAISATVTPTGRSSQNSTRRRPAVPSRVPVTRWTARARVCRASVPSRTATAAVDAQYGAVQAAAPRPGVPAAHAPRPIRAAVGSHSGCATGPRRAGRGPRIGAGGGRPSPGARAGTGSRPPRAGATAKDVAGCPRRRRRAATRTARASRVRAAGPPVLLGGGDGAVGGGDRPALGPGRVPEPRQP